MIKSGTIIENDQGKFAKVVSAEDGRFGISAFVFKKEDAERETVAARTLNTFGLSQVIKGEKAEKAAPKPPLPKVAAIGDLKVAALRKLAKDFELEVDGTKPELVKRITDAFNDAVAEMDDLVVTADYLKANPELAEMGVKEGDTIKVKKTDK